MPFLSIIRNPLRDTRSRTQRFSLSTQNRLKCKFGLKVRLFRLLACDTLFPATDRLPVIWHTLDFSPARLNMYGLGRDLYQNFAFKGSLQEINSIYY